MGKIVVGLAAPHNPNITSRPEGISADDRDRLLKGFGHLHKSLVEASPDCLIVLTTDHLTNFFYHNNPMFCLAVSDTCSGPAPKEIPDLRVPKAKLKVDTKLARGLLHYGIENEIDFSHSEDFILDHAFMVPLNFVTPHMDLPIVPVHIGGMLPPGPTARRCYKLGQHIRQFVNDSYTGKVAVLVSGSIYGDVGGPTMGSVDTAFEMEFLGLLKEGNIEEFVRRVTPENIKKAGVSNELLAWVTLQGVLGPAIPSSVEYIWAKGWSSGAASLVTWQF